MIKKQPRSRQEVVVLSERLKISLLLALLLLTLGIVVLTTVDTVQAIQQFQQQYHAARAGDVSAIRPWMTPQQISHICHVPKDYLYKSLEVASPTPKSKDKSLEDIAHRKHQTVDKVVLTVKQAIIKYRKQYHSQFAVPQLTYITMQPEPGRKNS